MFDDTGVWPLRRLGRSAVLLEVDDSPAVYARHAQLRRRRDAGEVAAVEILPGARTVLIDGVPDAAALHRRSGRPGALVRSPPPGAG